MVWLLFVSTGRRKPRRNASKRPGKRPFRECCPSAIKSPNARPLLKLAETFKNDPVCSSMKTMVCDFLKPKKRSKYVLSRVGSIVRIRTYQSHRPVREDPEKSNITAATRKLRLGSLSFAFAMKAKLGWGRATPACVAWINIGASDR